MPRIRKAMVINTTGNVLRQFCHEKPESHPLFRFEYSENSAGFFQCCEETMILE